ncbi:MAG: hypothetical protein Q9213_000767 [Squamulea squamosa]
MTDRLTAPPTSATAVTPPTSTSESANRIRDNQRRSRARRKDYILELEEKVRGFEQRGVEASAEIQTAARKVVEENLELREKNRALREENERLRALLGQGRKEVVDNGSAGARESRALQPSQKRKRGTDSNGEKGSRRDTCGFGGLRGCTGPGCPQENPDTATASTSQPTSTGPTSPASSYHSNHHTQTSYPSPTSSFHQHLRSASSLSTPQQQPPQKLSNQTLRPQQPPSPAIHPCATEDTDTDMSSCHHAALIITSMRSDISHEQVHRELGCTEKVEDCKVGNQKLLSVMDRLA